MLYEKCPQFKESENYFLANGNKLENGTKIVLRIDDKDYDGVVVKANYEKDLSHKNLTILYFCSIKSKK